MRSLIQAAAVIVAVAGTVLGTAGAVSAAGHPAPRVLQECHAGKTCADIRPGTLLIAIGPTLELAHAHWKSWGAKTATATGTLLGIDVGRVSYGSHVTVKLYDVRTTRHALVNKHGAVRFYDKLDISGGHAEYRHSDGWRWYWPNDDFGG